MMNPGCVGKEPSNDAPKDHVWVACATKQKNTMSYTTHHSVHRSNHTQVLSLTHSNRHEDTHDIPSLEVRGTLNLFMSRLSCSLTVMARRRPL